MVMRLNRMSLLGLVGLLGTLAGCADDSGMNVANGQGTDGSTNNVPPVIDGSAINPPKVTDGSAPTNVTTVTDTATATTTVTMTVTSLGTDGGTANTGTVTATATSTATGTATQTATVTATSVITVTGTTSATSTNTYSAASGYVTVVLNYPPAWSCPTNTNTSTGVGGATGTATLPTDSTLAATDCKSLANLRKPILKTQSQNALASARSNLLYANCTGKTERLCVDKTGKQVSTGYCSYGASVDAGVSYGAGGAMAAAGSSGAPGIGGAAGSTGATEYSTTNTQVASVDEADYVKNDGNSIFVLAKDGLHVVDAWPAAETHEVAHVTLPGEPRRLYFSDNRLVVYSRIQATGTQGGAGTSNPSDQGCTYGYDCRFSSEGGHTLIQVFDVTAPATPVELMRYELSGGYVDSRRIGAFVYTVAHDTGATQIPGLDYTLQATSYEDLQAKYAQRIADNNAKIDATSDDYFLPWVQTVKPDGTTTAVSSCQQALVTQGAQGASFVSINTFDLTKLGPPTRTVIGSNAGYIYASATALYMAVDRAYERDSSTSYYYSSYQATDSFVHKFNLNGADTSYVGSVTLTGHILNQFSMDESDGVLRVASTKGWVPDPSVISYLTTYGMQAGKLVQLGQVGGIGPQEDIRSVRFDGNRGYVVTFKKTDPLFVFDLTDATKPKLMGELQIPGFSTYMQRLDDTHVLAIGFTADDHESFAFFNGIQIQIFDVSDLANPKLAWKYVIGTRGSSSEALTNHLAFNYFAPKKMLALPITVCEGGGNGSYATNLTFAGVMAFDISLDTGISEHGRLPFMDAGTVAATDNCDKWWTDSKSLVKRSIFMDDYIYGLSDTQMRVAALPAMSSVLKSLPLSSL
jgi:uncharacterized secreted protein with C-terminal beta-propeller domain